MPHGCFPDPLTWLHQTVRFAFFFALNVALLLRRSIRRKGVTIPYTDILIASTALAHEAILLHADAHFDLAAQITGLKVESFVGKLWKKLYDFPSAVLRCTLHLPMRCIQTGHLRALHLELFTVPSI